MLILAILTLATTAIMFLFGCAIKALIWLAMELGFEKWWSLPVWMALWPLIFASAIGGVIAVWAFGISKMAGGQ